MKRWGLRRFGPTTADDSGNLKPDAHGSGAGNQPPRRLAESMLHRRRPAEKQEENTDDVEGTDRPG
ncbi:MAG: hypothetical protein ACOY3P_25155 [Planctomycetota bacterium]